MDKEKSRILQLIEGFLGVESVEDSLDEEAVDKSYLKAAVKNTLKIGGAIGVGVFFLPFALNKISGLLGVGIKGAASFFDKDKLDSLFDEEISKIPVIGKAASKLLGNNKAVTPQTQTLPANATPIPVKAKAPADVEITQPSEKVAGYLDEASQVSGVDKAVLFAIAHQESKFNVKARSRIGARGLLQITPSTWNQLVSRYGRHYGIKRKDIDNPRANAIMGALYVKQIIQGLKILFGHAPSITDIYAGYFLGPRGVKKLLSLIERTPGIDAVRMFPQAAQHNKGIFLNNDGSHKSVLDLYQTLYGKVGLQYYKFSSLQHTKPEYAATSIPMPMDDLATEEAKQQYTPQQVKFTPPPDFGGAKAVPIPFDMTPQDGEYLRDKQQGSAEKGSIGYATSVPNKIPEFNFIRDKRGTLVMIGAS